MHKPFIGTVVAAVLLTSCSSCMMESELVSVWGGDVEAPKLVEVRTLTSREVEALFTVPVTVVSARVQTGGEAGTPVGTGWESGDEGRSVRFILEKGLGIGETAILSVQVEDGGGNSLSFSAPFTGFNERPACLRINEIRTEYDKPKVEYVEFIAIEAGNLAGLEIQNAMNADHPRWEFPAAEVAAGDYVVWHLRSLEEGLVDETGETDVSAGCDADPEARDFWDTQTKAPLKKNNVIILRERKGGKILDAVLLAEAGKDAWPDDALRLAAEEAVSSGAWGPTALVTDAVVSTGTTPTRTIGRNERSDDSNTAPDWAVCPTGKKSPGSANAPFPGSP